MVGKQATGEWFMISLILLEKRIKKKIKTAMLIDDLQLHGHHDCHIGLEISKKCISYKLMHQPL